MKVRLRLVLGIMAIALLFAVPASATYMNLQADSNWNFTFTPGTVSSLTNAANFAQINSIAFSPVESVPLTTNATLGGASVQVNHPLGNLLHQEANNNSATQSSHTHVTGLGPTNGTLNQNAQDSMSWTFTVSANDTYHIVATNTFTVLFQGDNSGGDPAYDIGQFYLFTASLTGGGHNISTGGNTSVTDTGPIGSVVAPWDLTRTGPTDVDLGNIFLETGNTYTLSVSDRVLQNMSTNPVPVPPSLLLLGSGLLGLVGLRYRRRS